jgi:NADH-quinone oxidoreductase subunit N
MMLTDILLALKHELIISLIIFLLLFWKIRFDNAYPELIMGLVNALLLVAVLFVWFEPIETLLFNQMFGSNALTQFQKSILSLAMLLISGLSYHWLKNNVNRIEFYLLLLSSLLGMFFMISSANLLMFYLGLELSTIPLAAAANFDLEKRKSSEAAMKLILSSAFSSALLLLGVSFLYGCSGTLQFSEMSYALLVSPLSQFGFILLFAGFAFKISAVPFHLWTADVYEGSPVPVTAFLSVASKAAVMFVFVSVLNQVFQNMVQTWFMAISILVFLSIGIGNLFALRQENLKRFLAFSSISQIGYILIGILGDGSQAAASIYYFLFIYLFSNLAAFGVIGIVSEQTGKESINDFKGFYQNNKFLSWVLAIALFSLAGVPPTAGFFGKFFLLIAGGANAFLGLMIFAALNLVVSFYYYLRVVKAIFMDANESPLPKVEFDFTPKIALYFCLAAILLLGFYGPVYEHIVHISKAYSF